MLLAALPALAGEKITRTLTLTWNASPAAKLAGYRVYYGTASGIYPWLIDVGLLTTADIPNCVDGTTYYFTVKAYTLDGDESDPSEELQHTVGPSTLLNISTRGFVGTGENVLIAGFIIGGSTHKTVALRALGPSLAAAGVSQPLADPKVNLYGASGLLASNDNWRDGALKELLDLQLAPTRDIEAGMVITLPPGRYSVVVQGGATPGVALLEVYDVGPFRP